MRLFEHIRALRRNQTATLDPMVGRFADVDIALDTKPTERPGIFRWEYSATVSVVLMGPLEKQIHLADQAELFIGREMYGEVIDDLYALSRILSSERYRPADDNASVLIRAMIEKMEGGR